ncbi:DUF6986 family protein [Candidatus Palauibacter sp.]|uniref:DUF6986 family protein n=1 Tax=Candidatus Palauibacter sp. TaxID=3101350 RepID=UPI003B01BD01
MDEQLRVSLGPNEVLRLLSGLQGALAEHHGRYPGDAGRRQPVHTVAGGAQLFRRNTAAKLGRIARGCLDRYAGDPGILPEALGGALPPGLSETLHARVREKLEREPVESFLIDFEDGFGVRSDGEEDAAARAGGQETAAGVADGGLPPGLGIRIKPLSGVTGGRGLRTLDLFLTALADAGEAPPDGFFVLLPKIVCPEQVAVLARALDRLEEKLGLPPGAVSIDVMIETPQALIGPGGRASAPGLVAAAGGRCRTAHLGAYDLTGAASVAAAHQTLDHPLCDVARQILKLSLAETGVQLSDGATNVLPVEPHRVRHRARGKTLSDSERAENRAVVHEAWRRHYADVRRSLAQGYYQGWDLHPAQLVSRYAAVFSFFLEGLEVAARRLERFIEGAGQAILTGSVFDDEASGQGLLNFFARGLASGALTEVDAARSGLSPEELEIRSFREILERRGIIGG